MVADEGKKFSKKAGLGVLFGKCDKFTGDLSCLYTGLVKNKPKTPPQHINKYLLACFLSFSAFINTVMHVFPSKLRNTKTIDKNKVWRLLGPSAAASLTGRAQQQIWDQPLLLQPETYKGAESKTCRWINVSPYEFNPW